MSNNIFPVAMRDTSTDLETGWTRDGLWEREYPRPSTGVMGLGGLGEAVERLPRAARRHALHALNDRNPVVRRRAAELAQSSRPGEAFARQAEEDLAEAMNPTGKPIVLKSVVDAVTPKLKAVENALVAAAPGQGTYESRVAQNIFAMSPNPEEDLREFYEAVALRAVYPELSLDQIVEGEGNLEAGLSGLADLGKKKLHGLKKLWRKYKVPILITAGVAAAVFAGPVVLPLMASAASTVGKAVIGGAGAIFGRGPTQQQVAYDQQIAQMNAAAQQMQATDPNAAAALRAQAAAMQRQEGQIDWTAQQQAPQVSMPSYYPQQPSAPAAPAPSFFERAVDLATNVYLAKVRASQAPSPGATQDYQAQRETLITRIMSESRVSRTDAEHLADQAIGQLEAQRGAAPVEAGMFGGSGMMLPLILIGGVAVVLSAKGGRR